MTNYSAVLLLGPCPVQLILLLIPRSPTMCWCPVRETEGLPCPPVGARDPVGVWMFLSQASNQVTLPRDQLIRLLAPTPFPRFAHRPPPQRNVSTLRTFTRHSHAGPDRKPR